jgi:transcriptional regulator with GAF, ATPase, and Fis domain
VLQEREIERVGGTTSIRVDVRIIAATNRDLLKAVAERNFREDLYYRLSVFPIRLPPLRERAEDIPILARFLIDKIATRTGSRIEAISQETMRRLVSYRWPGNVRELENVLERTVILATGSTLELEIGGEITTVPSAIEDPLPCSLEAIERRHISGVLRQTNWVIDGPRGAAGILGLHPNTLRSRLKKLGLIRPSHEPS